MASEETERAQPPASLAWSDLAASQQGGAGEAGGHPQPHRGMQRDGMQRDIEGCRHRQEEAGAYRKQRQHGDPQGKRGTLPAQSNVSCGAAAGQSLPIVHGGTLHPAEGAAGTFCIGQMLAYSVRTKS